MVLQTFLLQIKSPAFPVEEPPKKLKINLDLAIYRGRTLVFKRQFSQAETIFRKVSGWSSGTMSKTKGRYLAV